MLNTTTLAELSGALTVGTPYLSAFLTQSRWPRYVNEALAFLVCAVAGVLAFLLAGGTLTGVHDLATLSAVISGIFVGAKVYYLKLGVKCPLLDFIAYHTGEKQVGLPPPAAMEATAPPPDVPAKLRELTGSYDRAQLLAAIRQKQIEQGIAPPSLVTPSTGSSK